MFKPHISSAAFALAQTTRPPPKRVILARLALTLPPAGEVTCPMTIGPNCGKRQDPVRINRIASVKERGRGKERLLVSKLRRPIS